VSTGPRVLLINYEYPPLGGGAGTATAGMARALAELGADVVVLTSRFRGQPAQESTHRFRVARVPVRRRRLDRCTPPEMLTFLASACWHVLPLTRRWRPDVTIAFFAIPSGPVAWLVRAVRGTPFIVSLRGGDVPGFEWAPVARTWHRLTGPWLRLLWRRADRVVANSRGLAELARRAAPGLPIAVVPNGASLPAAPPAPPAGVPRLLTMGRLTGQKGIDLLLQALAQLTALPFALDIAGDGPDRAALERMAAELGLAARVRFHGWVARDDVPALFASAAAFVLASRIEGMPNVVLEAMASSRAVVATRVSGCEELIEDGVSGLLVEVEDVTQLTAALRRVLTEPALRDRLGIAARHRVESEFTWTRAAQAYLELAGLAAARPAVTATPGL
jgi:glycosyltransferase involved in cell wall biosynthesis